MAKTTTHPGVQLSDHTRLIGLVACLGFLTLLLGLAVVVLALRDTRDWFVPPTQPGYLRPGELAPDYLTHEAALMAELRLNWTKDSLPHKQQQFKTLLTATRRKAYDQTMHDEVKFVKENKIQLSQFTTTRVEPLAERNGQYKILVHGLRTILIHNIPNDEAVTVVLVVRPLRLHGRPHGLEIVDIDDSPLLKIAGR
jgi:hypothetical protein